MFNGNTRLHIRDFAVLELYTAAANWLSHDRVNRVENLLAAGVDPNARFDSLESVFSGIEEDWASCEKNPLLPRFSLDETEEPPLYTVIRHNSSSRPDRKAIVTHLVKVLLKHGADPYALYRQPLHLHGLDTILPKDPQTVEDDDDDYGEEWLDITQGGFARRGIIEKSQAELMDEDDRPIWFDSEDYIDYEDRYPHPYGVCSVIHTLLEDGVSVEPLFRLLGDQLDVERRDPWGLTLFLAVCLSGLGLDGAIDGNFGDTSGFNDRQGIRQNPFPQPDNPYRRFEKPTTTRCTGPSLLDFFISRGSNLLAVDNYGRNALHLIFINKRAENSIAIKYLIKNCPSLINQPDKAGFYPLHMAIHWMGIKGHSGWTAPPAPEEVLKVEVTVYELLAAGADPLVRDGRGNTVLHYLAASKLGQKNHNVGREQKRLLQLFLDRGVDPQVRNTDGLTALELFLNTKERDVPLSNSSQLGDNEGYRRLGEEIIDIFVKGGYDLEERNAAGQTPLHVIATQPYASGAAWFVALQAKGLDPLAKDHEGNTPLGLAKKNGDIARFMKDDIIVLRQE